MAIRDERIDRRTAIARLDEDKADAKDMMRLAEAFDGLKKTLQWFIGIVATALVAFAAVIIQIAVS